MNKQQTTNSKQTINNEQTTNSKQWTNNKHKLLLLPLMAFLVAYLLCCWRLLLPLLAVAVVNCCDFMSHLSAFVVAIVVVAWITTFVTRVAGRFHVYDGIIPSTNHKQWTINEQLQQTVNNEQTTNNKQQTINKQSTTKNNNKH